MGVRAMKNLKSPHFNVGVQRKRVCKEKSGLHLGALKTLLIVGLAIEEDPFKRRLFFIFIFLYIYFLNKQIHKIPS